MEAILLDPWLPFWQMQGINMANASDTTIERNLGEQPIAQVMLAHGLKAHDLVANSAEQITHKMIARACKGRRLTPNVQSKVRNALVKSTGKEYSIKDLFTY